jgi:hypothetical protein
VPQREPAGRESDEKGEADDLPRQLGEKEERTGQEEGDGEEARGPASSRLSVRSRTSTTTVKDREVVARIFLAGFPQALEGLEVGLEEGALAGIAGPVTFRAGEGLRRQGAWAALPMLVEDEIRPRQPPRRGNRRACQGRSFTRRRSGRPSSRY